MAVQTWTFDAGFEGWTFEDVSADISINPCPGCSATRSHVAGAIRTTLVLDNLANVTAAGLHKSPIGLNTPIVNLDTIAVDYSATSDAPSIAQVLVEATYSDTTTENNSVSDSGSGTLTLTLTQSKTLDFITVRLGRSTGGSAVGSTHTRDIEEVRLTTATATTPTPGKLKTPSTFLGDQGGGAPGGAGGGFGNIASISADGENIYIASFNNLGFPTLIKIGSDLTADGSVVFDPGAGGRIGVQCGVLNAEHVWIAGQFDGTNTIEKSENAGSSFTVKDDASFGVIRTLQVGPSDDTRVIVFDGDNGDIIETIDDGETWTITNATVTPLVNSIARLNENPEEIVAGNQGDATNSINYSPNTGVDLEDYQTGVYPNADATVVIVN